MPTRRRLLSLIAAAPLFTALRSAEAALPLGAPNLGFLDRLPEGSLPSFIDDAKLLLGWTADAAALADKPPLKAGDIVDRAGGFASVPGFAPPTDITGVAGRYRLLAPPFRGHYYYGLMFGLLDATDRVGAVLIANRLCRLPVVLHEPGGLGSDAWTDVGLMTGFRPASLKAALAFADQAKAEAGRLDVPLIATGQSQAGGTGQLQVAHLLAADPKAWAGFVTFNAACSRASIRHVGFDPARLPGVNFAKDLDPLVGPHSNVSNEIGLQVYIHTDGTAGLKPRGSYFQAALHPHEHFLDSFNGLSLGKLLAEIRGA
jgi:hypothetical protein